MREFSFRNPPQEFRLGLATGVAGLAGLALCGASAARGQTLDTLNPGANSTVSACAVQPDGRIVVAGDFTRLAGVTRNRLARLNADGTPDLSFNPNVSGAVIAVALQPDGKVIVGGTFTNLGEQAHFSLGRLNPDGSLDSSFTAGTDSKGSIYALALQPDGKILIGGYFVLVNGQSRSYLARLNGDGSLDTGFTPGIRQSFFALLLC